MNEETALAANGTGGDFYWRFCATGNHINEAVKALLACIYTENRIDNPHQRMYLRTLFRRRIEMATKGELNPPDELKGVAQNIPQTRFFEIRWADIAVLEKDPSQPSGRRSVKLQMRLYYAEPEWVGLVLLGLHCHEKSTSGNKAQVRAAQDEEIRKAIELYSSNVECRWGVDILAN